MTTRMNVYFNEETNQKFIELKNYLDSSGALTRQQRNNSPTLAILIDTFYKLFIETSGYENYFERLSQLEKNLTDSSKSSDRELKSLRRQIDQLLYLELTNFHAITKGNDFDIQDLESIHSRMDPIQHELIARIQDVIQEDVARGQTIKNSH